MHRDFSHRKNNRIRWWLHGNGSGIFDNPRLRTSAIVHLIGHARQHRIARFDAKSICPDKSCRNNGPTTHDDFFQHAPNLACSPQLGNLL